MKQEAPSHGRSPLLLLALGALGVVYGDIGTSPLYALRECFHGSHGVAPTPENVLGVLSLVFWALIVVISIKYLVFIMRADNRGEGGILALMALVRSEKRVKTKRQWTLVALGLFGAALLYGDGMLTPAISVLSAVEGLEVATHLFQPYVVPITIAILIVLFSIQRHGTSGVGAIFGPITLLWFAVLAVLGAVNMADNLSVLKAIDPQTRLRLLRTQWTAGFPGAGRCDLGDHRRRGALRRHGAFRSPAHPAGLVRRGAAGAADQLFRPGRPADRQPRQRRTTRSTAWRRSGRCIRWWCSRQWRPRSLRRR